MNTTTRVDTAVGRALDDAPLSLFHLRAFITAGAGFFTDAYDLFIIGTAMALIKSEWHLSAGEVGLLGGATLVATLLGAIVFGRIADVFGRKRVYGLEAAIMVVGAVASALAPSFLWLVAFRFILGIGIGGDYPVSGVIMSEYANRPNRGKLVSLVFSMQALGLVIGPVVALTLLASGIDHSIAWRLMLGLGALPALAVIYLRRRLPESPRFVAEVRGDTHTAATSIAGYTKGAVQVLASPSDAGVARRGLGSLLRSGRFVRMALATAGAWFLLDYAYYGNTISTPLVLKDVAPGASLLQSTAWSLIIFAVFAVPGYVLAFMTIDRIGHRRLQWLGFLAMAACFGVIGLVPGVSTAVVPFLAIYGLSYLFTEFGPNVTTFVIPTEVFPVAGRTTGHGIAAGIGKLGAFIGVFLFPVLTAKLGLSGTLLVSAGAAVAGAALTAMLPEAAGKSLSEMEPSTAPATRTPSVPAVA